MRSRAGRYGIKPSSSAAHPCLVRDIRSPGLHRITSRVPESKTESSNVSPMACVLAGEPAVDDGIFGSGGDELSGS